MNKTSNPIQITNCKIAFLPNIAMIYHICKGSLILRDLSSFFASHQALLRINATISISTALSEDTLPLIKVPYQSTVYQITESHMIQSSYF